MTRLELLKNDGYWIGSLEVNHKLNKKAFRKMVLKLKNELIKEMELNNNNEVSKCESKIA